MGKGSRDSYGSGGLGAACACVRAFTTARRRCTHSFVQYKLQVGCSVLK